jgi:hypothetical protein
MRTRARAIGCAAALTLAACGDRTEPARVVTRDSAGVSVVESAGELPPQRGSLARRPTTELDRGASPPAVVTAVRVGDGFAVLDTAGRVRWFDVQGRPRADAAPPGGSGRATWIGVLPGDSLAAWDAEAGRLVIHAPDGTLARFLAPARLRGASVAIVGAFADGSLLATVAGDPGSAARAVVRVRRDGGIASLGSVAGDAGTRIVPAAGDVYWTVDGAGTLRKHTPYGALAVVARLSDAGDAGRGAEIVADPAGHVWRARPGDEDGRWEVFAPDGRWIARMTGPGRFRVTEVGDGWALGVHTAADGTEWVRLHAIRPVRFTGPVTVPRG